MEQPTWTDVWGIYLTWASLGISFLSLVAAGIAVWKLFIRDKEQVEAMISLTKMSNHYAEMLEEERKNRHRSIRPFFHITKAKWENIPGGGKSHTITMVNLGETAFVTTLGQLNEQGFYCGSLSVTVITKNVSIEFSSGKTPDARKDLVAYFRDIDGNVYEQQFKKETFSYNPQTPVLRKTKEWQQGHSN